MFHIPLIGFLKPQLAPLQTHSASARPYLAMKPTQSSWCPPPARDCVKSASLRFTAVGAEYAHPPERVTWKFLLFHGLKKKKKEEIKACSQSDGSHLLHVLISHFLDPKRHKSDGNFRVHVAA